MNLDFVLNKLIEYYPEVGGYFIISALLVYSTYKIVVFYKKTEQANEKLPKIEDVLKRIDRGFATLNAVLLEKSIISQSCYSQENSPRVVNEIGNKLYRDSGAEKLFEDIKDTLLNDLKHKTFDSLLELERECLNVLLDRMNDKEFRDIQNFAFQHPTFNSRPLTYTDILFVLSLKLRELYREKHSEKDLKLD